jgi:hypothetical protein
MKRVFAGIVIALLAIAMTPACWATTAPLSDGTITPVTAPVTTPVTAGDLARLEARIAEANTSADNAWVLTSAVLVLMMTGPGLALF